MNYDEHVVCLNECMAFIPQNDNHVCMFNFSSIFLQFICMYMFMGRFSRMVNGLVASSSSVEGLGMLQCGNRATGCSMGLSGP